jgi:hypothetical protein
MRKSHALAWSLGLVLLCTRVAAADVWDIQAQNDNSAATGNELIHGSDQMHDLGVLPGALADQDWYRLRQEPFSSYEILVDATSGDIGTTLNLDRIGADGTTVVQSSRPVGLGFTRSLRWANTQSTPVDGERIRVTSGSCTTDCGPDDVYQIRTYETTYAAARFNNSGSQFTVVVIQNPTDEVLSGTVYFWDAAGSLLLSNSGDLAPRSANAFNTASDLPGASGSITIAGNLRYGDLAGKAVALEPSTGFSFDTPLLPRMR